MNRKINDYIWKQIVDRKSTNNDAYKWLVNEIEYYKNPNYINTKYTKDVLNKMLQIINVPTLCDENNAQDVTLMLIQDLIKNT